MYSIQRKPKPSPAPRAPAAGLLARRPFGPSPANLSGRQLAMPSSNPLSVEGSRSAAALRAVPAEILSSPHDPLEREADASAARVLGAASSATGPARMAAPASTAAVEAAGSGGAPLPAELRAFLEPRFGYSFGDVRVHANSAAAEAAESVSAAAFTVGAHVVFGDRQYAPATDAGLRLLAHELTHVVQQQEGRGPSVQLKPLDRPKPLGAGMRKQSTAPCPGTPTNYRVLTNEFTTPYGVGNPTNVGDCPLRIMCYDKDGVSIKGSGEPLNPGQSLDWYWPVEGAAKIGFYCEGGKECGKAILAYDTPAS